MSESIQRLRVYTAARTLEDRVHELIQQLDTNYDYPLGNDLQRSSTAVGHYISEAHRCFSYGLKLENLTEARIAAESAKTLLSQPPLAEQSNVIRDDYDTLIRQIWGFIRYLKFKRNERVSRVEVHAKDELVAARS